MANAVGILPFFRHILIVGMGLVGGSVSRALRRAGYTGRISGMDSHAPSLAEALRLDLADDAPDSPSAAADADLVLIAVPVARTEAVLLSLCPFLRQDTIVTDAGSTKSGVAAAARRVLGERAGIFVAGHPIAGSEKNGPAAATADLFAGKRVVITPSPDNTREALDKVSAVWAACGATVHMMTPDEHDRVFAVVSHLPHLLAYALVDMVSRHSSADRLFQYAASGFRDFTRIAASSADMWRDISMANGAHLLEELDRYLRELQELRDMLVNRDADNVHALYLRARQARLDWEDIIESGEKRSDITDRS
ncbi:MAG: prephenate dehydrogenase/arogenate dehydrogenase family protein [Burkholderiaceae bacterium]|jgi:prephenate dehydrogenase|nr:prephenate dehydrogenase/arogenate dehydrogenase family protein [Burkholderiaceae bacterium]